MHEMAAKYGKDESGRKAAWIMIDSKGLISYGATMNNSIYYEQREFPSLSNDENRTWSIYHFSMISENDDEKPSFFTRIHHHFSMIIEKWSLENDGVFQA